VWTRGMARHHLLTGDPWMRETVELIGDSLADLAMGSEYPYFTGEAHCGRSLGWPLIALGGAYELGSDPRFLRAMRALVDRALKEQDPSCGGWLYELPW